MTYQSCCSTVIPITVSLFFLYLNISVSIFKEQQPHQCITPSEGLPLDITLCWMMPFSLAHIKWFTPVSFNSLGPCPFRGGLDWPAGREVKVFFQFDLLPICSSEATRTTTRFAGGKWFLFWKLHCNDWFNVSQGTKTELIGLEIMITFSFSKAQLYIYM